MTLQKDEEIISKGKIHWAVFIPYAMLMIYCIIIESLYGALGVVIFTLPVLLQYFSTFLILTNKRIMGKVGILKTRALDTPLGKINNASVDENLIGKVFGFGTITITSSSGSYVFKKIAKASAMSNAIMGQIETYSDDKIRKQAQEMANAMKGE